MASVASYKIILLGDSGVGKTSIWRSLKGLPFLADTSQLPEVVLDTFSYDAQLSNGTVVTLEIVDTGGAEKYQDFTRHNFADGSGVVFVYEIDSIRSFRSIQTWVNQEGPGFLRRGYKSFVIGNKKDLNDPPCCCRAVHKSALVSLVDHKDSSGHKQFQFGMESSAKTDPDGLKSIFHDIAETLHGSFTATYGMSY